MLMKTTDIDSQQRKSKSSIETNRVPSHDIDTANSVYANFKNENGYFGRKKIFIPVSPSEFRSDPIHYFTKYIGEIEKDHVFNVSQIKYLNEVFKGKHDILLKTRANSDTKINNKSITNFFIEWNSFKKGYYVGKPIKYVDINGSNYDYEDMKYFNLYMRDINKSSIDMVKYEKLFTNGVAYTMTYYKDKPVDTERESPFEYTVLDNTEVCVVYSTDMKKSRLFSLYFTKVAEDGKTYTIYTMEFGKRLIKLKANQLATDGYEVLEDIDLEIADRITEYCLNEQRMSIIEMALNGVNTVNKIRSNLMDQQEEHVNAYIVFMNVDTSKIDVDNMRSKRVFGISSNNASKVADVKTITTDIEFSSTNAFIETIIQDMFDIVGVPRATSNTGQGVSGEAQTYGGGWENAQNVAKVDTTYLVQYEREDLGKFIELCQNYENDKLPNLYSSGIDIKYTLNKSNNMMVKAQSAKYFVDMGFTREQALTYCEITDDPQNDGKIADDNAERLEQRAIDLEYEKEKKIQSLTQTSVASQENN